MQNFKKINLIVIHPLGRAGSTFLQSLFDGHPSIVGFPSFGCIFNKINQVIESFETEINIFIENNVSLFNSAKGYFGEVNINVSGKFGKNADQDIYINIDKFKKECLTIFKNLELQNHNKLSRIDFFKIIHIGYSKCFRNINFDKVKYVLYHPHSVDEFEILINSFPNLFLFTLTRDPRQDWESFRKVISIRTGRKLSHFHNIDLFNNSIVYSKDAFVIHQFQKKVKKDQFIVLDLIEFHRLNKKAMEFFCKKLDIDFDETLLQSTFNGLIWSGNAASRKIINGFNLNMNDRWAHNLSKKDIQNLSILNYGAISCFGYKLKKNINAEKFRILASKIVFKNLILEYSLHNIYSNFFAIFSPLKTGNAPKHLFKEFLKRIFVFLKSIILVASVQKSVLKKKLFELEKQQRFLYNNPLPKDIFLKEKK